MASLLNKDPASYKLEKDRFHVEIQQFHSSKGTPYKHLPIIEGKEVDLYKLYWIVTAHGGWERVNAHNGWEEISTLFDISESTANGALGLKQVYLRYLDSYEKAHFVGVEEDNDDNWYNDEEDSRSRRQKAQKIATNVPLSYNQQQHNVADEFREQLHMSTNVYRKTDYDRLSLSLTSPLPNEQDFAINVCTLLSNEGRHTLKLSKCPRLLDLLLGHAGVYNHENFKEYMTKLYLESRNYDLLSFWNSVCQDKSVLNLMLKYAKKHKDWNVNEDILALECSSERFRALRERAEDEIGRGLFVDEANASDELFATGPKTGTRELAGQRILQVATILRNLSFEEDNSLILSQNVTLLRFCLLCCSSQWCNLNQMGFDILSNISMDLVLEANNETCITEVVLSTLITSISSSDRFQVISSLDVLNKLSQNEVNEDFISEVLVGQESVFKQLVSYLSLHDIHLLISVLECLYSISSLGESSCNAIVRTHGALDALVSLITVEAQSYGPGACILMRVVETVPGAASQQVVSAQGAQATAQPGTSNLQTLTSMRTQNGQQTQVTIVSGQALAQRRQQQMLQQKQLQAQLPTTQTQVVQQQLVPAGSQLVQVQEPPAGTTVLPLPNQVATTQQQQQPRIIQPHVVQQTSGQRRLPPGQVQPQRTQQQVVVRNSSGGNVIQQNQQVQQQQQQQLQQQQHREVNNKENNPSQVQLRVSNDEANRSFCLSWLKATYEGVAGGSIQHEIMYKQYLASLHKLGKRDVISAQLYAVCVRSLFGGSVGPNKRQLTDGRTDRFFEGVKVRAQPLPLRIPVSSSNPTNPNVPASSSPAPAAANPTPPNVLYQAKNVAQPLQQQAVTIQQQPRTTPAAAANAQIPPVVVNNNPCVNNSQVVSAALPKVNNMVAPSSPILTNLLHRRSPGPEQMKQQNDVQFVQQRQNVAKDLNNSAEENGISVLDGILPKDPKFGMLDQGNKITTTMNHVVNGTGVVIANNHKTFNNGLKRLASTDLEDAGAPPAKAALVTNGLDVLKTDLNLAQAAVLNSSTNQMVKVPPQNQMAIKPKVLQSSCGQQIVMKNGPIVSATAASVGGGNTLLVRDGQALQAAPVVTGGMAAGPQVGVQNQKTIIILQPNTPTAGNNPISAAVVQQSHVGGGPLQISSVSNSGRPLIQQQPVVVQTPQQPQQSLQNGQIRVNGLANPANSQSQQQQPPPQQQQQQPSPISMVSSPNVIVAPSSQLTTPHASLSSSVSSSLSSTSTSVQNNIPSSSSVKVPPKPNPQTPFLCEWQGCLMAYKTPKEVENHAIKVHCPLGHDNIPCLWARCDGMKRKRFSLMTHIQDRHCHPQLMKLMAVRRVQMASSGKSDVPLPPTPPPHPGYAPNAAYHAIKRHATEFANPKAIAMSDEKEGPVTKSIRLTSSLILKNLVIYSGMGKKRLKSYESHLATVALSNVESSRTVSQILSELADDSS